MTDTPLYYVEVAVNAPIWKLFHYHVPLELRDRIAPGHLVRVGFGTAVQPAIVVERHATSPIDKTKPVLNLLDPWPVLTQKHIELGLWMSQHYLTPPGPALWTLLPPGLTGRSARRALLLRDDAASDQSPDAAILAHLRDEGPTDMRQLEKAFGMKMARQAVARLERAASVETESYLTPPSAKPRTVRTVRRAIGQDDIAAALDDLSRAPKQRRVFAYIARYDAPLDVRDVYTATGATSADLNKLADKQWVTLGERIAYRDSLADRDFVPLSPPPLIAAQRGVWERVRQAIVGDAGDSQQRGGAFLLHGVTGSGKTEIYLRAIAETLAQGRQAILLVPEIALTPQTIRRVAERYPDQVALVHGSLSTGERYDTWQRARRGEVGVIVGTRSALFTALPDCGLIVLDEEHDTSYKHSPPFNPPFYHARHVAEKMMRLNAGVLLLGSATPDLETRYRAQRGDLTYLHLPERIMGHRQRVSAQAERVGVRARYEAAEGEALTIGLPPVQVVDMRDELKSGNRSMFSRDLQAELRDVIDRGEQAILFLNRRGQATYVFCRDCGAFFGCPRCDTPMTYHRAGEALKCHHCGHEAPIPQTCPECGSTRIKYFGAGTQQVESELHRLFGDAVRSVRWDADTARKPDMHEAILAQFVNSDAQIMIGTQMVAKGLDLPLVTLVGVVSADPGLALPDFRAGERAFQTLAQVSGRAGRGILGGRVILQTYQPDHPSIRFAASHDYDGFYAAEMQARRELGYPPFRRLGRVLIQHTHPIEAQREAEKAADALREHIRKRNLTDTHLIGPAPCFFSRIDRHYRWQVLVRSTDPAAALRGLPDHPAWTVDIDPVDVL